MVVVRAERMYIHAQSRAMLPRHDNERIQNMAAKKKKKTTKKKARTTEVKPRTKTQIFGEISDKTELSRKQVAAVFDEMSALVKKDLGNRGPGTFTVPGLMKIKKVKKPRRLARKGVNPFTGEEMMFKAKPAHSVVKVLALKNLKEMV